MLNYWIAEASASLASDMEIRNGTVYADFAASYYTCFFSELSTDVQGDTMLFTSDAHVFIFLFLFKQGTFSIIFYNDQIKQMATRFFIDIKTEETAFWLFSLFW